ncbi:G1 family glutamic endopeptidase [Kibdelosporangium aridum]|nr:G1 family glutamic endopeptidase [Kibdelosporangium aridum]
MTDVTVFPPAPAGFDALTASRTDLMRYGLPQRPDPRTHPVPAALWEQRARRYQSYEHLEPRLTPATEPADPTIAELPELMSCGFELFSNSAPITMFSGTWTVPNLNYTTGIGQLPNSFRTFFGLGFLDVHVLMSVDPAQSVTSVITIHTGAQVGLPVRPGDTISATLCLLTNETATAHYFLANQTTKQTVNVQMETGFPPAVTINAGVSRGLVADRPSPLAKFGAVYFDELTASASGPTVLLTNGTPTTMVDFDGKKLATPVRLNDFTFKVVHG